MANRQIDLARSKNVNRHLFSKYPDRISICNLLIFISLLSCLIWHSHSNAETLAAPLASTSNIAILATVTASSAGTGQPASAAVDGVIDGWPYNEAVEWSSYREKAGAWLDLTWSGIYAIDRIVLYDRPNIYDQATSLELRFSSGTIVSVGALENAGGPMEVLFEPVLTDNLQIVVTSVSTGTANIGLAEVEIYGIYNGTNSMPVADAGIDQGVTEGVTVVLDGTGSIDPDGDVLRYSWTQTSGTQVVLNNTSATSPTFVAPSRLAVGPDILTFELVVRDGILGAADVVSISVDKPPLLGANNITNLASVTASSEATGQPASAAVDGVIDGWPNNSAVEWSSNQEKAGAWFGLSWPAVYTIDRVVLYDRPNQYDQATSLELRFNNGTTIPVGALDNAGGPTELQFPPVLADGMRIVVTSVAPGTANIGLAEVEIYGVFNGTNHAPVANAGADQDVYENTVVILDGTASSDPDNDTLTYLWTQTAGTAVTLSDATAASPSFVAPAGSGTLIFSLVVNDGAVSSSADMVSVITKANTTNIANLATLAASSEASGQPATASVDGVIDGWPNNTAAEWSSDREKAGAWLEFSWSGVYTVDRVVLYDRPNQYDQATSLELRFKDGTTMTMGALDNAGGPTEIKFPPVVADGLQIAVTSVAPGTANVGLAEVEIYGVFSGTNRTPVANAGIDQSVYGNTVVVLDGTGSSDPDSDALTYTWTQTGGIAVVLSDPTAVIPTFVAPTGSGMLTFSLVVNDGSQNSVADEVTVQTLQAGPGNIANRAIVTASSEDSGQPASAAVDGVIDGWPNNETAEWSSRREKSGAWLNLSWLGNFAIDRVVLYDRPNQYDHATSLELRFNDGTTIPVGAMNNNGTPIEVQFPPVEASSVQIVVTSVSSETLNVGLAEVEIYGIAIGSQIPDATDWVEYGVVLSEGNPGSWDVNLADAISPSAVVKKDGTFFLYYIGSDGVRSTDGGPRHRAMGVATSTNGINFTRYSGNPILTFLPNNNQEEGLFSAGAMIDDNGEVLLYYSGCDAGNATSQQVNCSGYLATSPNGLNFSEQGIVLDYADNSVWGSGDELFPVGAFKNNGTYYVYYIAKGTNALWDLGLATGSTRTVLNNSQSVLTSGDNIVGGVNPVFLSPTQIALFVVRGFSNWYTEVRTISPSSPENISSTVATYDLDNVYHTVHFLDTDTNTWFMYYLDANNIIRAKTAFGSGL